MRSGPHEWLHSSAVTFALGEEIRAVSSERTRSRDAFALCESCLIQTKRWLAFVSVPLMAATVHNTEYQQLPHDRSHKNVQPCTQSSRLAAACQARWQGNALTFDARTARLCWLELKRGLLVLKFVWHTCLRSLPHVLIEYKSNKSPILGTHPTHLCNAFVGRMLSMSCVHARQFCHIHGKTSYVTCC